MIELTPITSGSAVATILSAVETVALINGSVRTDDLVWDDDALVAWYIEQRVDPEFQAAYSEEPKTALDEAREVITSELVSEIRTRQQALGAAYPFDFDLE